MILEHLVFLDSVSFLPCRLRKLPKDYGLSESKSRKPQYFITEENLNHLGPIPDVSYYGVNEKGEEDWSELLAWYENQKIGALRQQVGAWKIFSR